MSDVSLEDWVEVLLDGKPLWRHKTGAQVYQSSLWKRAEEARQELDPDQKEIPTWKAQRSNDVQYGDDDGLLYMTREDAMRGALS